MTVKELIEYHAALVLDRERLFNMRQETYKLDQILSDVQEALRVAIAGEAGEDNKVVAELRATIAGLEKEACLYYRADGTAETLHSKWSVTDRRKADARDLALLRARVKELEALVPAPVPPDPTPETPPLTPPAAEKKSGEDIPW